MSTVQEPTQSTDELRLRRLRRCVDALERQIAELRSEGREVPAELGQALASFRADLAARGGR